MRTGGARVERAFTRGALTTLALLGLLRSVSAQVAGSLTGSSQFDLTEESLSEQASSENDGERIARAVADDRWLKFITDSVQKVVALESDERGNWSPRPIPLNLPVGESGKAVPLPLLVLPLVVRDPIDASSECGVSQNNTVFEGPYVTAKGGSRNRQPLRKPLTGAPSQRIPPSSFLLPPIPKPTEDYREIEKYYDNIIAFEDYEIRDKPKHPPPTTSTERDGPRNTYTKTRLRVTAAPRLQTSEISRRLVELFRAQTPRSPELPPAVIPVYEDSLLAPPPHPRPPTQYEDDDESPEDDERIKPSRPRFDRSVLIAAKLTVPKADYTEPYTVWWDAETGASRVDFHGGATSIYRQTLFDGRVQLFERSIDRTGPRDAVHCARAVLSGPTCETDIAANPALPPIEALSFDGYAEVEGERLERWRRVERGASGELGAARGEALTVHHELLLRRTRHGYATPIKYTVSVDSSVLGPRCDGYEHRYLEVREQRHEAAALVPDNATCDHLETLDVADLENLARLDPLREFTLPDRDPRYDAVLESFKRNFSRQYVDDTEEAVRKQLLVQSSRFVNSGNRQGASFKMRLNMFGDLLDVEMQNYHGAVPDRRRGSSLPFPYSRAALEDFAESLPARFDWRKNGFISSVRLQDACMSCYAFAVAGAVEGALARRVGRMTELSEKAILDCGREFGAMGCNGSTVNSAYEYVRAHGLPPRHQYPPYEPEEQQCHEGRDPPVRHTRIRGHVDVPAGDITAMKVAIQRHGPTVIYVNSGNATRSAFHFFHSGRYIDKRCPKEPLNHVVLAVGWHMKKGKTYFILKNSWGTSWGENGFVRVFAPENTCGILSLPSFPLLEEVARRERPRPRRDELDYSDELL